jgi:hypothetical protein
MGVVIPALGRLRLEGFEIKVSPGYIMTPWIFAFLFFKLQFSYSLKITVLYYPIICI